MDDSYVREFEAVVTSIKDEKYVVLDTTAFYPNSGGQPHDTGRFICGDEEYQVIFVGKFGDISHEVSRPGLKVGDKIKGVIDWDRRYRLMRSHTASHVLSAVFHDDYGALITGNALSLEKIRTDFSIEHFDRAIIDEAVRKTNEFLAKDLPVEISYMPREEALKDPAMVKLAGAMPPNVEELRIVTIGEGDQMVDREADGGTHVKSTAECGQVELIRADNKGKANRRVYVCLIDSVSPKQ